MTPIKAQQIAITALSSCFSSEQAGGFENAENAGEPWIELPIEIHSMKPTSFVMQVDGHEILIRATVQRAVEY